jgi:hypothetical protein
MAAAPREQGDSKDQQDTRETHSPARASAGRSGGSKRGADSDASEVEQDERPGGGDGRRDPTREASGEALRRQMASPTIESVTTMVCMMCGNERFFDGPVPAGLTCFCGSSVFRPFDTPTRRDEATIAHLEEEARSVQLGDASPQTAPEDVRDLEMK